jgi:geranylgeranyl diphosphate synthase type I
MRHTGSTVERQVFEQPALDIDALLAPSVRDALASLDGQAPLLAGMARYHLGEVDAHFQGSGVAGIHRGKRVRPALAILSCVAAGGNADEAAPLAAALELLHNFTLIHDDVQDQSPRRRHRSTVWSLWGVGQAINAGDALFAAAHLPMYRLVTTQPAALVLRLAEAFDRMTIEIVRGQTLDLTFEGRGDVTTDDYLAMIEGKTAAIVRFAAWAGALLGGATELTAGRFATFGLALGLGFQIRDDALGIWGSLDATGKAPADDIRRRKQSLPILMLRERLGPDIRDEVDGLYAASPVGEEGVTRILSLLGESGVREDLDTRVIRYHDEARAALLTAGGQEPTGSWVQLHALVDQLAGRLG